MPATTEPSTALLEATRQHEHARCLVCGRPQSDGLGLHFRVVEDGAVEARFDCHPYYEGYNGMLHGGVISALADGAMANCLFAHGIAAVTAELTVRFRHPIVLGKPVVVRARIVEAAGPLYRLEARLLQDGELKVRAKGTFYKRPQDADDDDGKSL